MHTYLHAYPERFHCWQPHCVVCPPWTPAPLARTGHQRLGDSRLRSHEPTNTGRARTTRMGRMDETLAHTPRPRHRLTSRSSPRLGKARVSETRATPTRMRHRRRTTIRKHPSAQPGRALGAPRNRPLHRRRDYRFRLPQAQHCARHKYSTSPRTPPRRRAAAPAHEKRRNRACRKNHS